MNTAALILGIILGIALAAAYYSSQITNLQKQLQEANSTIIRLKTQLDKVNNDYATLQDNYRKLQTRYENTLQELAKAKEAYSRLYANYTKLLKEHEKTETILKAIAENAQRLHDLLLKIQDETLYRTVYGMRNEPDMLNNYIDWWSPEVQRITKEAIESTTILPRNAFTRIFDWISDHIRYSYDSPLLVVEELNGDFTMFWANDYWRKASETVREGHGDCEDMAILAAAMVKAYAAMRGEKENPLYEPMIVLLYGDTGHAFTALPAGRDRIIILDPAGRIITGKALPIWHQVEPEPITYAIDTYLQTWKEEKGITYTAGAVIAKINGHYHFFEARNIAELKAVLSELTEKYYQEG